MILTFEEKTMKFIDGVNVQIDLGTFIDNWMIAHRNNNTKRELGEKLGISHIEVAIVADKLANIGVKLPDLKFEI